MSAQSSDTGLIADLIRDLGSAQARTKLNASKAIRDLSQHSPEVVYPHLDRIVPLLEHENSVLKWNAILTLAHLAPVDHEAKLDRLLDRYLAPIAGPVMITASNVIKGAAVIALAKPDLAARAATGIMRAEKGRYATPECRNIAIGHAIGALQRMKTVLENDRVVRNFAARQVNNPRPVTARKATRLLESLKSASGSHTRSS